MNLFRFQDFINQRLDCRVRDRMVVWYTTTYAISAYHHWSCWFDSGLWRGVLDTTLYIKVIKD